MVRTHPTIGTHFRDFFSTMYTSRCVFMKYVRHHAYLGELPSEQNKAKHKIEA